ncbi:MAG: 1-deoxy-D-xylulose-5-phosphate synthase [Bacteroidales bacterium]|nr:1-deoxy-D-xylulose-5-phosphate synthase [Bacteroidales bacterium]
MYELLDKIDSPQDLKKLSIPELKELCAEIRAYMIECCSKNPGHLASSLGAVELIVAVHYVFDTPKDKFIFDVGHQAYAHKIITGRREAFKANRTSGGISGFPKMSESPYDAFGVGHSSTSISAALGYAEAARLKQTHEKVIALIGDGALTGGLAFEGMNNAGASAADLLVILNDNNHSIDANRGALHEHLLTLTTSPFYNKIKGHVWETIGEGRIRDGIQRMVHSTKSGLVKKSGGDLFEALGFRYFGPVDGHDVEKLVETFTKLRDLKGPRIIHCLTKKGKGYAPAEEDPTTWHAPGKFDPTTGERIISPRAADRYQDVFGQVLVDIAKEDERVVGITPAMASGCGMTLLQKELPSRFFDVGIEEEHAVTFSAGLAAGGMKPFCNMYSTFSQRAYDQIIHDVALQHLPVVFCFDRAGVVGEDGPTHHGMLDLAAYRSVPGMVISAPSDEMETKSLMHAALAHDAGPYIIRYPRGMGEGVRWRDVEPYETPVGKGRKLVDGKRVAVLALGPAAHRAAEAAKDLANEFGICPSVYDMRFLKPLDEQILEEAAEFDTILTLEDGTLKGGLFGAVCEYMAEKGHLIHIEGCGSPDEFIAHGKQSDERTLCGLDKDTIERKLKNLMQIS